VAKKNEGEYLLRVVIDFHKVNLKFAQEIEEFVKDGFSRGKKPDVLSITVSGSTEKAGKSDG
jgi:hypothetical protein